jgi:hypothetical protein
MTMNALDTALTKLAAASTALEYTSRPGLKDVETAKKEAKAASEILDAAHRLMSYGVYTVADAPMEPGPALFQSNGEPAVAVVPVEEPPIPTPFELLASWEVWTEDERKEHFDAQLAELSRIYQEQFPADEPLDVTPWLEMWASEPLFAFRWALFAIAKKDFDEAINTVEIKDWAENLGNLPALPAELLAWDSWAEEDQTDEFSRRLDALREQFPEEDDLSEDWDAWDTAWDKDRKDTFIRLLIAKEREPKSFTMPTDEERDAWLAAHAQPEAPSGEDPLDLAAQDELFEKKLDELEEAGVKESGLKRKNWKKTAAPAWREAYKADPAGTLTKLAWRIDQGVITWDVPTDDEVAA